MITILLNGSERRFAEGASVRDVLAALDVTDERGVAVAVDGSVLSRSEWEETQLSSNQRVEVVKAVQGG